MYLVTGYTGFVGSHLRNFLSRSNLPVRLFGKGDCNLSENESVVEGRLSINEDYSDALRDVTCIFHCAGMSNDQLNEDYKTSEIRCVNALSTIELAKQANKAGVQTFVFLSSAKVFGEISTLDSPLTENDVLSPKGNYANSKAEAEKLLLEYSKSSDINIVILRPPIIYGVGVKGNFKTLIKLVKRKLPLPVLAIDGNLRSFISVQNLVDVMFLCSHHPNASNQIFNVSDDCDLSTAELFQIIAESLARKPRFFWVPVWLLNLLVGILGKKEQAAKLLNSFQLDVSKVKKQLSWEPLLSTKESLNKMLPKEAKYK